MFRQGGHIWKLIAECVGRPRPVEVDNLPLAITAVPHPAFLWLDGSWWAVAVDELCDSDVSDACCLIPNKMDVRIQDCCVDRLWVLRPQVFKVKSVEVESFDQISQSLWFKGCYCRVTHFSVALEVSIAYGLDELLCHSDDVLFTSSRVLVFNGGVGALRRLLNAVVFLSSALSSWTQHEESEKHQGQKEGEESWKQEPCHYYTKMKQLSQMWQKNGKIDNYGIKCRQKYGQNTEGKGRSECAQKNVKNGQNLGKTIKKIRKIWAKIWIKIHKIWKTNRQNME